MEKFSQINPHFFQPLLPGFESNFSIPKSFLKYIGEEHKDEANDERISTLTNHTLKSSVKLRYFNNKLRFKDGWETFCNNHGLKEGDFLVFRHHQNLDFDVFVFDPTGCERPFPGDDYHLPSANKAKSSSLLDRLNFKGVSKNGKGLKMKKDYKPYLTSKTAFKPRGYPYCHTIVKPYCLTWGGMLLPRIFIKQNDLENRRCDIVLKDQKGKEWTVTLRNCNRGGSTFIGKWRNFHNKQGLETGDSVIFELIE